MTEEINSRNVVSSLRRREPSTGTERRLLELFTVRLHLVPLKSDVNENRTAHADLPRYREPGVG
jgi:hypothetical protein